MVVETALVARQIVCVFLCALGLVLTVQITVAPTIDPYFRDRVQWQLHRYNELASTALVRAASQQIRHWGCLRVVRHAIAQLRHDRLAELELLETFIENVPTPDEYEFDLYRTAEEWFFGEKTNDGVLQMYDSLLRGTGSPHLPRMIYTTDTGPIEGAIAPYSLWASTNPGWTIQWKDDEAIDAWLEAKFGDAPIVAAMRAMRDGWGILRSDLFR